MLKLSLKIVLTFLRRACIEDHDRNTGPFFFWERYFGSDPKTIDTHMLPNVHNISRGG